MNRVLAGSALFLFSAALAVAAPLSKGRPVTTHRYDEQRSGVNDRETVLDHETVSSGFGKLFEVDTDGEIYAQPLYVPSFRMADGSMKSLLVVATMKGELFAFDADRAPANTERPYLWRARLKHVDHRFHENDRPISWFKGILSTPYIDIEKGVVYTVAMDISHDSDAMYKLYKIDLGSGRVLKSVEIKGSLAGTGADAKVVDGESRVVFDPNQHLQRTALTYHEGYLHFGFGSLGDRQPFHGWIFSYKADDLSGGPSFISTPHGTSDDPGAGIWQSGQGFSVDPQGDFYVSTGNGEFSEALGNWGNSLLKLRFDARAGRFAVVDHFTPFNFKELNDLDLDIGSAGIIFVPPRFAIGAGKSGKFYVMDKDHLGGHTPERHYDAGPIQVFQVTEPHYDKIINDTMMWNIHGSPVPWKNRLYVMGESDPVKAFEMDPATGMCNTTPVMRSSFVAPIGMPGGFLSLSVNPAREGESAIVWVVHPLEGDATFEPRPGILHALDASDLSRELWNSKMKAEDDFGTFAKFVHPVIADGRVFMASKYGKVFVYGRK